MQIRLYNVPKKFKTEEVRSAVEFFGSALMSKRLLQNISVRVVFVKDEENSTEWEDDNLRPREFTIRLFSGMGYQNTFITLAHEMVHVKQFARGELRDYLKSSTLQRWQGKMFDSDKVDYWDLPWEIEAYGREKGLYWKFRIDGYERKKNAKAQSNSKKPSHSSLPQAGSEEQEGL
jgi:hypothetical protein